MTHNEIINQTICKELVNREVVACISDFAEHLFGEEGYHYADYDEFRNAFKEICPECGEEIDIEDCEEDEESGNHICPHCGAIIQYTDAEPVEPLEFWIVTPWFGEKLAEHGEMVLERWGGWVWGRQTSGQSIALDSVVEEIASGMQILCGQKYSWEGKC